MESRGVMKKKLVIVLSMMMTLWLCACGNKATSTPDNGISAGAETSGEAETAEDIVAQGGDRVPSRDDTLFQVALLQSLAQGYFDGIVTVGELKQHGDTGIGTFEGVNGEMIVLDGVVYQAIADGSIAIPSDEETVPFSNVTFFDTDETMTLSGIDDMAALQAALNDVVDKLGANCFYMVKIEGMFDALKVRSEYKQEKPYRMLDVALAADQTEFDYKDICGTMVGLYCPDYMGDLNSVGWHFHFINEDRTRGGHVLQVSVADAEAAFDMTDSFEMALSREAVFQGMELSKDMDEAIHRAETATVGNSNGDTTASLDKELDEIFKDAEVQAKLPEDNGMVGVYKWVEMGNYGMDTYLILWDDGIGSMDIVGTGTVRGVFYDDEMMQTADEGTVPQKYTYSDGKLIWTYTDESGEHTSTFIKLTADERAAYEALGIGSKE